MTCEWQYIYYIYNIYILIKQFAYFFYYTNKWFFQMFKQIDNEFHFNLMNWWISKLDFKSFDDMKSKLMVMSSYQKSLYWYLFKFFYELINLCINSNCQVIINSFNQLTLNYLFKL